MWRVLFNRSVTSLQEKEGPNLLSSGLSIVGNIEDDNLGDVDIEVERGRSGEDLGHIGVPVAARNGVNGFGFDGDCFVTSNGNCDSSWRRRDGYRGCCLGESPGIGACTRNIAF